MVNVVIIYLVQWMQITDAAMQFCLTLYGDFLHSSLVGSDLPVCPSPL